MATPNTTPKPRLLRPATIIGLLAVLAPLSYAAGRLSALTLAHSYLAYLGSGLALGSMGAMIGIPIGLFFGSFRSHSTVSAMPVRPNTIEMEHDILKQLRAELIENQSLFEARKGSTTMYARIAYITPFWESIKASGRLFVMQDAALLNSIAIAYYWLDQATHLETLAYQAKYAGTDPASPSIASHLISEARLLDGQVGGSLQGAIAAVDEVVQASSNTPANNLAQ